jgi:hypothetical protein
MRAPFPPPSLPLLPLSHTHPTPHPLRAVNNKRVCRGKTHLTENKRIN